MYRRCGFRHERRLRALGISTIAGIDEAGRGALAGPVVAAAVILPEKFRHRRLNDSKQLLPERREEIYHDLTANEAIAWAVGIVDSVEIDAINILRATHKAMRAALDALGVRTPEGCEIGFGNTKFRVEQGPVNIDGNEAERVGGHRQFYHPAVPVERRAPPPGPHAAVWARTPVAPLSFEGLLSVCNNHARRRLSR